MLVNPGRLGAWISENYVFKSFSIDLTLFGINESGKMSHSALTEKHRVSELWAESHALLVIGARYDHGGSISH